MDCYIDMYRNTVHILEILNTDSKIDSSLLINYIELLLETLDRFKEKYNVRNILDACRNDMCYQKRYEKEYPIFEKLFNQFLDVNDKIRSYYDYLERGIVTH